MQQSGPCLLAAVAAAGLHAGPALAAPYDFVPAPQTDLNRIYRIDKATGEVISCQYYLQEGTIGVTLCFGPGEGAGAQAAGEYGLVPSRHEQGGRGVPGQLPQRRDEHLLRARGQGRVHAASRPGSGGTPGRGGSPERARDARTGRPARSWKTLTTARFRRFRAGS